VRRLLAARGRQIKRQSLRSKYYSNLIRLIYFEKRRSLRSNRLSRLDLNKTLLCVLRDSVVSMLLVVLFQHLGDLARRHLAVVLPIDLHHRSQGAASKTVHRLKAEFEVPSVSPGFDSSQILNRVKDARSTPYMAGRPHADVISCRPLGTRLNAL